MHRKKNKIFILSIVIILALGNVGCVKMVEGYKKFNIQGFEEFFDIESLENQENYINSGKLDFCARREVLFIPFIKEISDTECAVLVFPYSKKNNSKLILNKVSLTTVEGDVISFTEGYGEIEVLSKWDDSMILVSTFNKSDEWFYNGNNLKLTINASINSENELVETEINYDITIVGYKGTWLQV